MKTNSPNMPSTLSNPIDGSARPSRLSMISRLLLATMCVSLVSFAAAPNALAAAPNGAYEVTSVSGTVQFDDETIDLPQSVVKRILRISEGEITIQNRTLRLNRNATSKIVTTLGDDLDIDVEASVSGPTSLVLTKSGDKYEGSTAEPIVTSFEGDFNGAEFSGELNTRVKATVNGKTLRIVLTFSGEALDEEFSGKIIVIAKR
jgi:hypothetical protein